MSASDDGRKKTLVVLVQMTTMRGVFDRQCRMSWRGSRRRSRLRDRNNNNSESRSNMRRRRRLWA